MRLRVGVLIISARVRALKFWNVTTVVRAGAWIALHMEDDSVTKVPTNKAVMESAYKRDEPIALAHKARGTERQKHCSWFAITTNSSLYHRVPVFSSSSRTTATVSARLLSRIQGSANKCRLDRLGQIPKEQPLGLIGSTSTCQPTRFTLFHRPSQVLTAPPTNVK